MAHTQSKIDSTTGEIHDDSSAAQQAAELFARLQAQVGELTLELSRLVGIVAESDEPELAAPMWRDLRELRVRASDDMARLVPQIVDRLDFDNVRSATIGGVSFTIKAPKKKSTDPEAMAKAVARLARRGLISKDAQKAAVQRVSVFKVNGTEVNKLLKHSNKEVVAAVAAAIDEDDVPPSGRNLGLAPATNKQAK